VAKKLSGQRANLNPIEVR